MMRLLPSLILLMLLSACAGKQTQQTLTLASIIRGGEPEPTLLFPPQQQSADSINTATLIKRYQAILAVETDPATLARVQKRITDLHMLQTERRHFAGDSEQQADVSGSYQQIISSYQQLLASRPQDAANETILYQLAKAYDYQADGEQQRLTLEQLLAQFPDSAHAVESHYRLGDIYYSRKDYAQAQRHYQAVIASGEDSAYYLNALYMRGWCLFKRSLYPQSLTAFTDVLDITLAGNTPETVEKSQQSLVQDTLHIMSVAFSYLDNGDSIAELYQQLGARTYEPLLYQQLATLLLERQIHHAAISTYQRFLQQYPLHPLAPQFQLAIIDAYRQGRYFSDVRPASDVFIQQYGPHSDYWQQADEQTRLYISQHIQPLLQDMASYHHALAQALLKKRQRSQAEPQLQQASDYYRQWITLYPAHEKTPEQAFLLGEALFELQHYHQAIEWYERAAYDYPPHSHAEEAAYAAILTYRQIEQQLQQHAEQPLPENALPAPAEALATLQQAAISSQQRYIQQFPDSDKTPQLWLHITYGWLALKNYPETIRSSQQAQTLAEHYSAAEYRDLLLIEANSYFELEDFARAEQVYRALRPLLPTKKEDRTIAEQIAASIYRQGEQAVAANEIDLAISHFQRVRQSVPESAIVVNADYDAATWLLLQQRWPEAISALKAFQQNYPKHPFNDDIPGKLIAVYEGMEDWHSAAVELRQLWRNGNNPEKQRQALFLAAQYEEKAGNIDLALNDYRSYANRYPEPFDLLLETRFKLSEMYRQKNDSNKRHYWLKQLIKAEKQQSNERSRYLAAFASQVFAEQHYADYQAIHLSAPLKKSLARKQKAFTGMMEEYQHIAAYQAAEFTTYATYKQAAIYQDFAKALLAADKPDGLNALELEQYDLLLEEQAYPFEEQAIAIFEASAQYSWQGVYDEWVKHSFEALKKLMPGRYHKTEQVLLNEELIL